MKIYNTLSRQEEEFKPLLDKQVGIYVCGPTVYGPDHLGQAKTWIFFDWLRRYFEVRGYKVKYVQNITDVGHLVGDEEEGEDKIEKLAKTEHRTPQDIARYFETEHLKDLEALNLEKPDFLPRATDYIEKIIDFVKTLIDKGYAYEAGGDVYFDVKKLPSYGELSGRNLDEMLTGTRAPENPKKRHPADFALWKKADPNHLQKWSSPWGEGYPGWHIECSVMSGEILGQPFDIHGSAVEHVFPHHENEIAQSRAYADKPLANYFLHTGMLSIEGKKMGKSLGNFITVKDALKKYDSDTIRLAFMHTLWRKPFNWDESAIKEAVNLKEKLVRAKKEAKDEKTDFIAKLDQILDDDFNTPEALVLINSFLPKLSKEDFKYLQKVFGLTLEEKPALTPAQEDLIKQRDEARKQGKFELADEIRKKLESFGVKIEDTPQGTRVI